MRLSTYYLHFIKQSIVCCHHLHRRQVPSGYKWSGPCGVGRNCHAAPYRRKVEPRTFINHTLVYQRNCSLSAPHHKSCHVTTCGRVAGNVNYHTTERTCLSSGTVGLHYLLTCIRLQSLPEKIIFTADGKPSKYITPTRA